MWTTSPARKLIVAAHRRDRARAAHLLAIVAAAAALTAPGARSAAGPVTIVPDAPGPAAQVTPSAPPSPTTITLMMQGAESLEKGQVEEATRTLGLATTDPNAPAGAYRLLAMAYFRAGRPEAALKPAQRSVELAPTAGGMRASNELLVARISYSTFHKQYSDLQSKVKGLPGFAALLTAMYTHVFPRSDGSVIVMKGDVNAAQDYADAENSIRDTVLQLKSYLDKSEQYVKDALKADPDLGEAHDTLGLIYSAEGKSHDARREFEREIAANGRTADVMVHQGELESQTGDPAAAIVDLRKAVSLQPDQLTAYKDMADSYDALGDTGRMHWAKAMGALFGNRLDEAKAELDRIGKPCVDSLCGRSMLALANKDNKSAREWAVKALAVNPSDVESLLVLAGLQFNDRDLTASEATFRKVIQLDPSNDAAFYGLGLIMDERQLPDKAIDEYREAVRCNPGNASALINLAADRADTKRTRDAINDLHLYLQKFPTADNTFAIQTLLGQLEAQPQ